MASLSPTQRNDFTGNTSFYVYLHRHRQRLFLQRNLEKVLQHNVAAKERASLGGASENANGLPRSRSRPPRQPKPTMDAILNRLHLSQPVSGPQVLKVEARYLKRVRQYRPKDARNAQPDTNLPPPFKARCRVSIYPKPAHPAVKADSDDGSTRGNAVYTNSQSCTIKIENDDTAAITMGDPFFVRADQLYVQLGRGSRDWSGRIHQGAVSGLAESYEVDFTLLPEERTSSWPPLLAGQAKFAHLWDDGNPWNILLVARIPSLSKRAKNTHQEMDILFRGVPGGRADLIIDVDCRWSKSKIGKISAQGPTPLREQLLLLPNVMTCYHFALVDKDKARSSHAGKENRREQCFMAPGYTCAFCDGRQFKSAQFLQFHFATSHLLFSFRVKSRKAGVGVHGVDGTRYDVYLDVFVDLARDMIVHRPSDRTADPRDFRWIKPRQDFEISRILRGDWGWLNEKKGIYALNARRMGFLDREPVGPALPRIIDLDNVPDIPELIPPKHVVPPPILRGEAASMDPNTVFIRGKSKRYAVPEEQLCESDNEVDEEWLEMKHDETIDDFEDIGTFEQQMMKMWDSHQFWEKVSAYTHMPHSMLRFARQNSAALRDMGLVGEFWKMSLNWVQFRCIGADCLYRTMRIVKGNVDVERNRGEGESTMVVDNLNRKKSRIEKGKGRMPDVGSDAMDVDQPPSAPAMTENLNQSRKKRRESGAFSRKKKVIDSGYCNQGCTKPMARPDILRCDAPTCKRRMFHKSCFDITERRPKGWLCPSCVLGSDAMDED